MTHADNARRYIKNNSEHKFSQTPGFPVYLILTPDAVSSAHCSKVISTLRSNEYHHSNDVHQSNLSNNYQYKLAIIRQGHVLYRTILILVCIVHILKNKLPDRYNNHSKPLKAIFVFTDKICKKDIYDGNKKAPC